eukprot:3134653-Pleurochrysis_carterae.AAC.1
MRRRFVVLRMCVFRIDAAACAKAYRLLVRSSLLCAHVAIVRFVIVVGCVLLSPLRARAVHPKTVDAQLLRRGPSLARVALALACPAEERGA